MNIFSKSPLDFQAENMVLNLSGNMISSLAFFLILDVHNIPKIQKKKKKEYKIGNKIRFKKPFYKSQTIRG